MISIQLFYASILLAVKDRIHTLTGEPERGSGGVSLEHVLIAIGGVIAAGIVVAAIATVINSKTAQLNP